MTIIVSDTCLEETTQLKLNYPENEDAVDWFLSDTVAGEPNVSTGISTSYQYPANGSYTINVDIVYKDCTTGTLNKIIQIEDCSDCIVMATNTFSPNADLVNDNFKLTIPCLLTGYSFEIYNRWGVSVFKTDNPQFGWNGNDQNYECPDGVYFYTVNAVNELNVPLNKTGYIQLFR